MRVIRILRHTSWSFFSMAYNVLQIQFPVRQHWPKQCHFVCHFVEFCQFKPNGINEIGLIISLVQLNKMKKKLQHTLPIHLAAFAHYSSMTLNSTYAHFNVCSVNLTLVLIYEIKIKCTSNFDHAPVKTFARVQPSRVLKYFEC